MTDKNPKQMVSGWVVVLCCAILAVVVAGVLLSKPPKDINSFQACKDAGGAILESYPEQCVINGKSFTNHVQSINDGASGYIGLTEQAALDKAATENKPARTVERNGESLPVTMDLVPGRLNLHVADDKVYKVQVETDGR